MSIITGIILFLFMTYGFFTGELHISGIGSLFMIIIYIYYMRVLVKDQEKDIEKVKDTKEKIAEKKEIIKEKKTKDVPELEEAMKKKRKFIKKKSIFYTIIGIIGLGIGCQLMITSASSLSATLGIPEAIMGLFTLSIGTSIPELVVTLSSSIKGLHDLSMGTVFGSVTFNILIGIGVTCIIISSSK